MSGVYRAGTGISANLRSLLREPFALVMLFVLPAISIQTYGESLGSLADLGLFETTTSLTTTGQVTGGVFATGALAGILGLFQTLRTQAAERRLVVSGVQAAELIAARLAAIVVTAIAVAVVTTLSLDALVSGGVESRPPLFLALFAAGVAYGLLGTLIGSVLPRELEGSLVLVMLADVDAIFASGLFGVTNDVVELLPLAHPHELAMEAVVEGTLASGHLLPAFAKVGVLLLCCTGAYSYGLSPRGGAS